MLLQVVIAFQILSFTPESFCPLECSDYTLLSWNLLGEVILQFLWCLELWHDLNYSVELKLSEGCYKTWCLDSGRTPMRLIYVELELTSFRINGFEMTWHLLLDVLMQCPSALAVFKCSVNVYALHVAFLC